MVRRTASDASPFYSLLRAPTLLKLCILIDDGEEAGNKVLTPELCALCSKIDREDENKIRGRTSELCLVRYIMRMRIKMRIRMRMKIISFDLNCG